MLGVARTRGESDEKTRLFLARRFPFSKREGSAVACFPAVLRVPLATGMLTAWKGNIGDAGQFRFAGRRRAAPVAQPARGG